MIKYGDLVAGYKKGVVRFILEPGCTFGTVCKIGDNWFYFSYCAKSYIPKEMLACEGWKFMLEMVYSALNTTGELAAMDKADPDEYAYYEAVLEENGCMGHIA